jgi:glycosyltransferase involved in cell wall biosynthesis
MKVLHVCAVAFGLETLLLPQIDYLASRGLTVEAACTPDTRVDALRARGYVIHEISVDRRIAPGPNSKSVLELGRLMRAEKYDLVHTHAPVASVLGRVAAKLAGVERIVYTAHGFYFHEHMPRQKYALYHGIEKSVAQITDRILVQSQEDYDTAVTSGLGSAKKIKYLGNGIDLSRFDPRASHSANRTRRVSGQAHRVHQRPWAPIACHLHGLSKRRPGAPRPAGPLHLAFVSRGTSAIGARGDGHGAARGGDQHSRLSRGDRG